MIDLHTHTYNSDGELGIGELVVRAQKMGYRAIAITDHCDMANVEEILERLNYFKKTSQKYFKTRILVGVELTHVPPRQLPEIAGIARAAGAEIIVVHGETLVEPVLPGTNEWALKSDVDILAHPGFITEKEANLARDRGIYLEISARNGHSLTNGYVVSIAHRSGAKLVLNTDAHSSDDLITREFAAKILIGAGISGDGVSDVLQNSADIIAKK